MSLQWTGERAIPKLMKDGNNPEHQANLDRILSDHLARYEFSKKFCRGKKVLDASCGSGYGTAMIREVANYVYGLDVSEDAIEYAKENYSQNGIEFKVCDLDTLDLKKTNGAFGTNNFDVIVSFETIEHLKYPDKFIRNCVERCQVFVFSIPINSLGEFHRHIYTVDDIKDLINPLFSRVLWFAQREGSIVPLTDEQNVRYIVGVAYHETFIKS
jgi:2-polyprenyl-3-methyl-5-hydroxy-6-metoxy-1,4-benzoquinol methylase